MHTGDDCKLFYNRCLHTTDKRTIYVGFYNCDVPVAIVRMEHTGNEQHKKEIEREYRLLEELKAHENFIRYFTREIHNDIVYDSTVTVCS